MSGEIEVVSPASARGATHINGIKGFRGLAKSRPAKFSVMSERPFIRIGKSTSFGSITGVIKAVKFRQTHAGKSRSTCHDKKETLPERHQKRQCHRQILRGRTRK